MVVDIGGGSTEFIIGGHYKALVTESLPLGCVSFTLRYFGDGKLSQANFRTPSWPRAMKSTHRPPIPA